MATSGRHPRVQAVLSLDRESDSNPALGSSHGLQTKTKQVDVLHGWSAWTENDIIEFIDRGGRPEHVPGEFLVVDERGVDDVRFIASVVSAIPYMYATNTTRAVHGTNVFDVVKRASIPWRWNHRALTDLALVGHTLANDTLHKDVQRVPGCGVFVLRQGKLTGERSPFWRGIARAPTTNAATCTRLTRDIFDEQMGETSDYLLSLTAGYDSRLLLGLALERGDKPRCVTMGAEWGTDQEVARTLCEQYGLEHQAVTFSPSDYLAHAETITRLASGTKTAGNWHSYIYGVNGGFQPERLHVVGSNGEFARTFFFDRKQWPLLQRMPGTTVSAYWAARRARRWLRFSGKWQFLPRSPVSWLRRGHEMAAMAAVGGDPLTQLDGYYTNQRVRHFIANGLRMMGATSQVRSPFMDARWIQAAAGLPRTERVRNRWHLKAMQSIDASLLDVPFNGAKIDPQTLSAEPKSAVRGYSCFAELAKDPALRETLIGAPELDPFISQASRKEAIQAGSLDDIEMMTTLLYAARAANQACASSG